MKHSLEFATLVELIQARSRQHPHQRAYTFLEDGEGETAHLSYAELDLKARAIAVEMQNLVALKTCQPSQNF